MSATAPGLRFLLAACIATFGFGGAAHAVDVEVTADPVAVANTVKITAGQTAQTTALTAALTAQTTALYAALQALSGQQTANVQAATQSSANMRTVQDQRSVTMAVENAKVQAATAATSGASVCNVITGAIRTQNLDLMVKKWRSQAVQSQLAWDSGYWNGSSTPMSADQSRAAWMKNHCATTPSQEDVRSGVCPSALSGTNGTSTATAPDDESADSLFNETNMSADQTKSAERFVLATIDPSPTGLISPGLATTPDGKRQAFNSIGQHGRKTYPLSIMMGLVGQTAVLQPTATSETAAEAWAEATAKASGIAVPQDTASSKYYPNGISDLGMLELRSRAWYFNPNWGVQLSGQNVDATAKDMAMMQSWQVYMEWRQYQTMREMDASLALISSILMEQNPVGAAHS